MEEREIKLIVTAEVWNQIKNKVETLGARFTNIKQKDLYLDNRDLLITNLARGLRVRFMDGEPGSIDFKSLFKRVNNTDKHPFYVEEIQMDFPLEIGSQTKLNQILERLGLPQVEFKSDKVVFMDLLEELDKIGISKLITIDKDRYQAGVSGADYVFDHIEGLGYFIEIELTDLSLDLSRLVSELLSSNTYQMVQKGYNEMFLQNNPKWVSNSIQHQLFGINPRWNVLDSERDIVEKIS